AKIVQNQVWEDPSHGITYVSNNFLPKFADGGSRVLVCEYILERLRDEPLIVPSNSRIVLNHEIEANLVFGQSLSLQARRLKLRVISVGGPKDEAFSTR